MSKIVNRSYFAFGDDHIALEYFGRHHQKFQFHLQGYQVQDHGCCKGKFF